MFKEDGNVLHFQAPKGELSVWVLDLDLGIWTLGVWDWCRITREMDPN